MTSSPDCSGGRNSAIPIAVPARCAGAALTSEADAQRLATETPIVRIVESMIRDAMARSDAISLMEAWRVRAA